MKKLYSLIISLLITQYSFAQWPANYEGVMLQAFYWDSFEDTKWVNLTAKVDEIAPYFNLIWIPNSGNCVSDNSMGYLPVYWLDHRSSFGGRERYLTEMIATYKAKGVGFLSDVVFNHKSPLGKKGSWIDFANEERTGIVNKDKTYKLTWTGADICNNDDGGYTKAQGWEVTGADDTGSDFSGARDLDHTSANVQQNCKTYLEFLLKELDYVGFRLDMVRGYHPAYTKIYNEYAKPTFCVGENWSGLDDITWWIRETGWTSAAFDFPLKFQIKEAFNDGNWGKLYETSLASDNTYQRYSVTFIDNHDTYRDENGERLRNNVLPANAYLLAMPGTPCIFLKHWKRYPIAIGNMILGRKAAGISNQSSIKQLNVVDGGVVLKTEGSKGSVMVYCGSAAGYSAPDGFKLISKGENYAFYVSNNITVNGLREGEDSNGEDAAENATVYVECEQAPTLYAWTPNQTPLLGLWPGSEMTETETIEGKTFWKQTFTTTPINIIFNNGAGVQTADIPILHDSYFTFNPNVADKNKNYADITADYYTADSEALPACVKPISNQLYVYFRGNLDYDEPYAWVWGANDKNFCKNKNWPGDKMEKVGKDTKGREVWRWRGQLSDDMPTKILINNCGTPQTADFTFQNGGYYTIFGLQSTVNGIQQLNASATMKTKATYNLNGQRVANSYHGLIIRDGKKMLKK
jgi:alpha-amylase